MSDFLGMFDSDKKAELATLRDTLEADKKRLSDELAYYKSVAKDVKKAKKRVDLGGICGILRSFGRDGQGLA